jgi:predicted permease
MGLKRWLYIVPLRLRSIFHRRQVDSELEEELQYHVDMKIDENVVKGMSREEACRSALLAMGGLDQRKEECRDKRGLGWLDNTQRNLAFLFGSLRRSPGYAISVIVTLALGIGAVTAIFSAVDQTVLRKPFQHYDRFAVFGSDFRDRFTDISYPAQIIQCIERGKSFEIFALRAHGRGTLNTGAETAGAEYASVSQDFFSAFNGKAELGRLFRPDEFTTDSSSVMVLTHRFWRDYLGGDPGIIGRNVILDSRTYQIVGVLSREFSPPTPTFGFLSDFFVPLVFTHDPSFLQSGVQAYTCLRKGVTLTEADAEVSVLCDAPDASPFLKERFKKSPLYLKSLMDADSRMHFTKIHGAFLAAVGFLFSIACMNGINLMLVRLSERRRELGIRSALGGSRGRVMRLIITESLALNLLAGLLGLILAWGMKPLLLNVLTPSKDAFAEAGNLDGRALLVAFATCVLSTLLIAMVPAWKLSIQDPQSMLRESGIAFSEGRKLLRLRASLVVICAAMAVVLLTGTGLMIRSVQKMMSVDRGFDPSRRIFFWIDLPKTLQSAEPRINLAQRLEECLQNFPGIQNVTTGVAPLALSTSTALSKPDGSIAEVGFSPVSPAYFRCMGMRLLKGRWLPSRPEGSHGVILINESMANEWFGAENPVGRSMKIDTDHSWQVIGVVSDVRENLRDQKPWPQYYYPVWQGSNPMPIISLIVKSSIKPTPALIQSIRKAIHDVEPQAGLRTPVELEEAARSQVNKERFTLFILELISALSMLLAVFGLFSVMAYSVNQRMKEFGIRLALGATARQVVISVLRRGFTLGVVGIIIGLFGSWMLTSLDFHGKLFT